MSDPNDSASTGVGASRSSTFLDFCVKVRNDDPSILPELGKPFTIDYLSEREGIELADALVARVKTTVSHMYLAVVTERYTKSSAEAMAKYIRSSKRLQQIHLVGISDRELQHLEEMLCCFLPAFQESASLKKLYMELPPLSGGGHFNLVVENMLTHTQSLRSLSLICPIGPRRHSCGCCPGWIKKEHDSTRAHIGIFAWSNDCLSPLDQST
jgi:hypothetical protein